MRAGGAVEAVSDEKLMQLYARGDADAFGELFARYHERAYAYFLRRTGSADRAADLYQDLFLRIHRARGEYDPARPFSPWFFQVARNLLVDALRRSGRLREVPLAGEWLGPGVCDADPERRVSACEQAGEILGRLSDLERYVLVGSKVHGREYSDLARELGKSAVAVKQLASRAVRRLRGEHPRARELLALP